MFITWEYTHLYIACFTHGNTYLKHSHVLHMDIFVLLSQHLRDPVFSLHDHACSDQNSYVIFLFSFKALVWWLYSVIVSLQLVKCTVFSTFYYAHTYSSGSSSTVANSLHTHWLYQPVSWSITRYTYIYIYTSKFTCPIVQVHGHS